MAEAACPHVNTAMIAAGFPRCAMCEHTPTPAKGDDLAAQRTALTTAFEILGNALDDLATEATTAAKVCRRRGRKPTASDLLESLHTAWRVVFHAEQAVDLAALDLATAGGADA